MAAKNINDFDETLEKEFTDLGFNYQDIKDNGVTPKGDHHSKMFGVIFLDNFRPYSDGVVVTFKIKNPVNEHPPQIEAIVAVLFNEMNAGKFREIAQKGYLTTNEGLPTKHQICNELIQLAKTISELDKKLNDEFTRLGFDLKELAPTLQYEGKNGIHMTKSITDDARLNPGHKLFFLFTVINSPTDNLCYIQHLSAYLARKNLDSNKDEILIQRHYWCLEAPLPTKDQVFIQMMEALKIKEVREKFAFDSNRKGLGTSQKAVTKKGQ